MQQRTTRDDLENGNTFTHPDHRTHHTHARVVVGGYNFLLEGSTTDHQEDGNKQLKIGHQLPTVRSLWM